MASYGIPVYVFGGLLFVVFMATTLALGYVTLLDARARGVGSPMLWALLCASFAPAAMWYWVRRGNYGTRTMPPTEREQQGRILVLGVGGALLVSALITPPDPLSQIYYTLGLVVLGLPLAYFYIERRGDGAV